MDALLTVFSGGATGLLGLLLKGYFDLKNRQEDYKVAQLNADLSKQLAEIESKRLEARLNADAAHDASVQETRFFEVDGENMRESFKHDTSTLIDPSKLTLSGKWGRFVAGLVTLLLGLVDVLRGALRPVMTGYLCGVVTYMLWWVIQYTGDHKSLITSENLQAVVMQVVTTILYVWSTAVTWWFGTRPQQTK